MDEDGSKECFGWFEDSEKILMDEFGDSSAQYTRKSSQKHKFTHEDYEIKLLKY